MIQTYYPRLLTQGAGGTTAYVWLIADGRGRIVRRAMSAVPPHTLRQRDAILERFPDIDTEREAAAVPDAAFPIAGTSIHPAGELGPDTVFVLWVDRAVSLGHVPTPKGPFLLGRAVSEQINPLPVRQLAAEAAPADVVWYVYTDDHPVVEAGTYLGLNPPHASPDSIVAAVRDRVRAKYPDGSLTCSLGSALPNRNGELIMTMSVRYESRSR